MGEYDSLLLHKLAPADGFEPPAGELTARCSTTELRRNNTICIQSLCVSYSIFLPKLGNSTFLVYKYWHDNTERSKTERFEILYRWTSM